MRPQSSLPSLTFADPPRPGQHIKKYSVQESRLVRETPALYESVVKPYVDSLAPSSISWVYNILDGTAEAENVLFRDDDPETGFVLTPDLCALFVSLLLHLYREILTPTLTAQQMGSENHVGDVPPRPLPRPLPPLRPRLPPETPRPVAQYQGGE